MSIPLNIAEGSAKFGKDRTRFLTIARGSALECAAITDALKELGCADTDQLVEARGLLERITAMLWKMTKS